MGEFEKEISFKGENKSKGDILEQWTECVPWEEREASCRRSVQKPLGLQLNSSAPL